LSFSQTEIGGGIITKKLLLAVLFIATLSLGSIATANAEGIETAQQTDNISSVEEKISTEINDIQTLNKSEIHASADKQETSVKNYELTSNENTKTTTNITGQTSNNQTTQVTAITGVTDTIQNATVTENNQNITVPILDSDDSTRAEPIQTITEQNNASGEVTLATREQVRTAAVNIRNFINKNRRAPGTVDVGGITVDFAVFARMAAEELGQLQGSGNSALEFRPVARAPNSQTTLRNGRLNLARYMGITRHALNFMNAHGRMSNHVSTAFGRMSPEQFMDMISGVIGFHHQNNRLPNFVTIGRAVGAAPAPESGNSSGGVILPIPDELQPYLQETRNTQVTNTQIQNLTKQITGGSNDINAATRLFNWVRDNIRYSFYRNTQRGAVGTLNNRTGNCVDQSHLLIALSRAAGIPARYVHGRCRFTSGNIFGHVWAEVWVNGRWYSVDSTSVRNTFGVIRNWVLITLHGRHRSLPF